MPVANIIEIHDAVLNCGSSPSRPSGMRPKRENATTRTNSVKTEAAMTYSHPKLPITPASAESATAPRPAGETSPHTTKAMASTAATPKTIRSVPWVGFRLRRGFA